MAFFTLNLMQCNQENRPDQNDQKISNFTQCATKISLHSKAMRRLLIVISLSMSFSMSAV